MNHTRLQSETVVKSFVGPHSRRRFDNELIGMEYFSKQLPVLELISKDESKLTMRTKLVSGIHVADITDDRAKVEVQRACGQYLKAIHRAPVADLSNQILGSGSAVLHGDFTVRNILVSEINYVVVAILDWEKMCVGEPMEELCWYEWTLRQACEVERQHLVSFYEGYGMEFPDWRIRKSRILERLQLAIDDAVERDDLLGVKYWNEQCQIANSFEELI